VDSLVLEERTEQQFGGGIAQVDEEGKKPFFLRPEVLDRVGGVEREKPLDGIPPNDLAAVRGSRQPTRLNERVMMVVGEGDESGMSFHATTVARHCGKSARASVAPRI